MDEWLRATLPEIPVSTRLRRLGPQGRPPAPGTLIGGVYRVIGTLGGGGMGVVLLAEDQTLGRDVAIKLVRGQMAVHEEFRARFLAEARAMARVRHENVVTIHAFGEHDHAPYFVMEYVDGTTLDVWRRRQGQVPPGDALAVLDQLCRGLAAIHASGAIHGDIKPSNVLIGPGLRVAITDLGLTVPVDDVEREQPLAIAGTPAYIAPERALGIMSPELAHRADLYSLGVLGFELLTGRLPFEADNAMRWVYLHVNEPPPAPSSVRPDLPPAIDEVLLAALAKDPLERTASAEAFRDALLAARARF